VCRHEPLLSGSTDADLKFPERYTSHIIDGKRYDGVFAHDLTLEEIKTLRAVQTNDLRDPQYNGLFEVSFCDFVCFPAPHQRHCKPCVYNDLCTLAGMAYTACPP
jgi:hypothetical protein